MKFLTNIVILFLCFCLCLLGTCHTEELEISSDDHIIRALSASPMAYGYRVDADLSLDYIIDALSWFYYVDETNLSLLLSSEDDQWGFFDKHSYFLMLPYYDSIYDYYTTDSDSPIFVEKNKKFGYLSRIDGSIIVPLTFTGYCELSEFANGFALGCNIFETEYTTAFSYVLLRADGTEVDFPDGIMPVSHPVGNLVLISYEVTTANFCETGCEYVRGLGSIDGEILIPPAECPLSTGLEDYFYPYACWTASYE